MGPNRRALLKFAGATATLATLGTAGYVALDVQEANAEEANDEGVIEEGGNDDGEATDELPTYTQWLALDDGLEFTAVDWVALQEYVEEELQHAAQDEEVPEEFAADPMIALPSEGLLTVYFYVAFTLAPYRLGRLLEEGALATSVEELLLANDVFVATGTVETEELDERLTADPGNGFFRQLERTAEVDEYEVYTPVDEDDDIAIAVSSDAIVIASGDGAGDVAAVDDPISPLETVIAAAAGDVDRATDDSEALAWLVETAGDGDVTVGQYGERVDADDEFPALENAEGLVSSLSVVDEETSDGDFAAIVDEPDAAALEGVLGASADEQSVTVDGNRVSATATWREVE